MRQQALSERVEGLFPPSEFNTGWNESGCESRIARRIVRREINQHEVALAVRANEQGGVRFAIELGADLSRKVQADVENLVGVGEHGRKRGSEFEADRTGFRLQLGSQQAHGGLQHGVDVDGGKLGRSLTGKSEQARHQRGGAAHLLADLRGLELFLRAARSDALSRSEYPSMAVSGLLIS